MWNILIIYTNSWTKLRYENLFSDPISPTSGMKQGDPLSPVSFNLINNRLIESGPPEIVVVIEGKILNIFNPFADRLVLVVSFQEGLQALLDHTDDFLSEYGLLLNNAKSFSNWFSILLWSNLGVSFTPEDAVMYNEAVRY